jgi:FMN phosphatase YigB (HAD superfamily)
VVFIDDRVENVAAAASLGIHGVRYEGSEQLTGELVRLGILPVQGRFRALRVQEA